MPKKPRPTGKKWWVRRDARRMPRPLRPGRPARARPQHTKPRPRSLRIGSHSAPRRPASRPGHARRPAHLQPLASACSTPAACSSLCPTSHPPLACAYKREVDSSTGNQTKYPHIADTVALLGGRYTARSRLPRCDSGAHTPPRDSPRTGIYPQNTPIFFDTSPALCSLRPLARPVHPSPCVRSHVHRSPPYAPRGPHVPLYDHMYVRPRMST